MVHVYPKKGFLTSPSNSLRVPYQNSQLPSDDSAYFLGNITCTSIPFSLTVTIMEGYVFVYLNNMADKKKTLYNEDTGWHATVVSSYLQVKSYGQSMTVEGEERISFCQRQPLTCDPIQNGHLWTYEQCKVDFLW